MAGPGVETPGASIGDLIWLDTHNPGVHDPDESGIADVRVTFQDQAYRTLASTTTDASGNYLFRDLAPGTYRVVVDTSTLPPNSTQYADHDSTVDAQSMVTVTAGESNLTQNFSFAGGADGAGANDGSAELPRTGANPIAALILGLAPVGSGAFLGLVTRRRYKIRAS